MVMEKQNLKNFQDEIIFVQRELVNTTRVEDLFCYNVYVKFEKKKFYEEAIEIQNKNTEVLVIVKKLHVEAKKKLEKTKEKQQSFFVKKRDPKRFTEKIEMLQGIVEKLDNLKRNFSLEIIGTDSLVSEMGNKFDALQQQIAHKEQQLRKRQTLKKTQRFYRFQADEQLAGERCAVCLDDVIVGRSMVRLNCEGRHVFCQPCIEGWFATQNTCPTCRHVFA